VFQVSATAKPSDIWVRFDIHEGYYLYRDRLHFEISDSKEEIVRVEFPTGEIHHDDYFGDQTIFRLSPTVHLSLKHPLSTPVSLVVKLQGCADAGLCYPPKAITLNIAANAPNDGNGAVNTTTTNATHTIPTTDALSAHTSAPSTTGSAQSSTVDKEVPTYSKMPVGKSATLAESEQGKLITLIKTGSLLSLVGSFLALGALLSLTPCVLPMVPIVAGLVTHNHSNARQGFLLSLAYVLGMSLTYTAAGMLCALLGSQIQALFQAPLIIIGFAFIMVLMALSMFGVFNVEMPSVIQTQLSMMSQRLAGGGFIKTFFIGALSALIVSACVAPPLVAALSVIGQTGDVVRGGLALGSLSMGMGLPLLLVGITAGRLLPRSGPWMLTVKAFFGVMLLAVAVWLLEKIVPAVWLLALWSGVAVVSAIVFFSVGGSSGRWVRYPLGALSTFVALIWAFGFIQHHDDPWHPFAATQASQLHFRSIRNLNELQDALKSAQESKRSVMLDFTADWCASCKEMERLVFNRPEIGDALASFDLLRVDVTDNTRDDQELLQYFHLFGPPGTLFFSPQGQEMSNRRLVGFTEATAFLAHIAQIQDTSQ
jgi:thiol:disulfide interchange protein DsbD